MKETTKLSSAIQKTRKGAQEGIEELYLLTYKDTYTDIRFSVEDEEYVWNTIRDVYIQVYSRRANMPEESLLRQWIRILIKDVAKQKGGVEITEFPELSETTEMKALESKANTTLIAIDDQLGFLEENDDETPGTRKKVLAILKIVVASLVVIAAVCIVVWVIGKIKGQTLIPNLTAKGFVATTSQSAIVVENETTTAREVYGWNDTADGKKYKDIDGQFLTRDWLEYDSKLYYFDNEGYMVQGEKNIDNQRCMFAETGELINISREFEVEQEDTILSTQMRMFGDKDDIEDVIANSISTQGEWIYYLAKDDDKSELPMLLRYKKGEGTKELIESDVSGYFLFDTNLYYCKDSKIEKFLTGDSGTTVTGQYQITTKGGYFYLKDSDGKDITGTGGYEIINSRTYRVDDGCIKYVKPGVQTVGTYTFTLNEKQADNKIYSGDEVYIEQGEAINSICTVGNMLYYSAVNRIGKDGVPVSQIYVADVETGERESVSDEFKGAMLNMYYYKDEGDIFMEYAPDNMNSVYGRLAMMPVDGGSIKLIDDSKDRSNKEKDDMLELIMVQDGMAYCYLHRCSWDGVGSYVTVLTTSPLELSTTDTIPLK